MKVIEKDVLTVERGFIAHQVNCQGVMGSGIALAIRNKWPHVFNAYDAYCHNQRPEDLLGCVQAVRIGPRHPEHHKNLYVLNVFSQLGFGREKVQTDYQALKRAMFSITAGEMKMNPAPKAARTTLHVPYLMGCDRGGGDWDAFSAILELGYTGEVVACKLPGVNNG